MATNYQLLNNLGARKTFALLQISCLLFGLLAFAMQSLLLAVLSGLIFIFLGKFNLKPTLVGGMGVFLAFLAAQMPLFGFIFSLVIAKPPKGFFIMALPPTVLWKLLVEGWQTWSHAIELFSQLPRERQIADLIGLTVYSIIFSLIVFAIHKTQFKALKYKELIPLERWGIYLLLIIFWVLLLAIMVMISPMIVDSIYSYYKYR